MFHENNGCNDKERQGNKGNVNKYRRIKTRIKVLVEWLENNGWILEMWGKVVIEY